MLAQLPEPEAWVYRAEDDGQAGSNDVWNVRAEAVPCGPNGRTSLAAWVRRPLLLRFDHRWELGEI
jgi:hypothetical protein